MVMKSYLLVRTEEEAEVDELLAQNDVLVLFPRITFEFLCHVKLRLRMMGP